VIIRGAILGVLMAAGIAFAGETEVRATVDSSSYLIGDPVTVRLEFDHEEGASLSPMFGDTLGVFSVLSPPVLEPGSPTHTTGSFVVSFYDSGAVDIPPALFSIVAPGETLRTVFTPPIPVRFSLVPVDTAQPIMDLKPPIDIPLSVAEIAVIAGIALAIAALLYLLYRFWKKRKERGPAVIDEPVVNVPPHIIAFDELGRLREERLWQQGRAKEYYSRISGIIRRYCENRFGIHALEETTPEILDRLGGLEVHREALDTIRQLLVQSDLVKFARFVPEIPEYEKSMTDAHRIVELTMEKPVLQVEGKNEPEGEHVRS